MHGNDNDPKPAGQGDPAPAAANNNPPGQGDPAPAGNQDPNPATPPAGGDAPKDPEGQARALAASRKEADDRAKELRESKKALEAAQAKLKEHEDAQKSEIDKANERAQAAEARLAAAEEKSKESRLRFEVSRAAGTLNFSDPEDAYRMIDWSKLEYDEDGNPQGVGPLVEELAKNKTYLVKQAQGNPARPPSPTPAATGAGNNGKLTSEDEAKRKSELSSQVRTAF